MAKSIFENLAELALTRGIREIITCIKKGGKQAEKKASAPNPSTSGPVVEETHPWRTCPIGQHWRRTHPLRVPPSEKNPSGITTRVVGCCKNPKRTGKRLFKDVIHPDEIRKIASEHFGALSGPPAAGKITDYEDADKYDSLIRGWTKYWNEVFNPDSLLDPDLVKALIASESAFKLNAKEVSAGKAGMTHGLFQLTDQAIKALANPKGELTDHLVMIDKNDTLDPSIIICAGIRWLFQKQKLTSNHLERPATWEETIANYKGYLDDIRFGKDPKPKGMENFSKRLKELKE